MAHNIHFLERIERLNLRQADRALGLYRDPQAVAFLLHRLDLPDAADRVALALAGGEAPPHIVLTRTGQFVTCLGAGMITRDLHRVPFDQMDRVLNQFGALRETLDGKITRGAALDKLKNLFHKSDGISREEFSSLLTLRPLLGRDLLHLSALTWAELDTFRTQWRPTTTPHGARIEAHSLSLYWRSLWASGHLTTLLVADVPELERFFSGLEVQAPPALTFTWPLTRTGLTGMTLRGWHNAACLGNLFLPAANAMIESGLETENITLHTIGGLMSLGLRHPDLRDEALRLIAEARRSIRSTPPEGPDAKPYETYLELLTDQLTLIFQDADLHAPPITKALRNALFKECPPGLFPRAEDIPEDIIYALGLYRRDTFDSRTPEFSRMLAYYLLGVARLEPQQLYLPEHILRYVANPTNKVDIDAVRTHLDYCNPRIPVVVGRKPGRNAPCTCGSGKKYKACCGR